MIATTVIVAAAAALVGCEEPLMPDDPPVGDAPGMKADPPEPPKQDEPPDPPKQDEPADESGFGIDETYDDLHEGARLTMRYDRATQAFEGTVENTTTGFRMTVRVEVVSGGTLLGQTDSIDLVPGGADDVLLQVAVADDVRWEPRLVFVAREAVSNSPGTPTPQQPTPQPPPVQQGPIDCSTGVDSTADIIASAEDTEAGDCLGQWYLAHDGVNAKDPWAQVTAPEFHIPWQSLSKDAWDNCPCWNINQSGGFTGYITHSQREWRHRKVADMMGVGQCPDLQADEACRGDSTVSIRSSRIFYKVERAE